MPNRRWVYLFYLFYHRVVSRLGHTAGRTMVTVHHQHQVPIKDMRYLLGKQKAMHLHSKDPQSYSATQEL